jgi:hypothetical protein
VTYIRSPHHDTHRRPPRPPGRLSAAATTAAEALDGARLDLSDGTLAELLLELKSLDGRLALDRLAGAADLVDRVCAGRLNSVPGSRFELVPAQQ